MSRNLPCVADSSGRQWQCAGAELAAGGAAGHTAVVEEDPAGDMRLAEEHASTRWGQAGGRAAGTGGVACLVEVLAEAEEGGWCSSK